MKRSPKPISAAPQSTSCSFGRSAAGGHTLANTTHGYRVAFGTLTVLALVGAALTTTMRVAHRQEAVTAETPVDAGLALIEEAA